MRFQGCVVVTLLAFGCTAGLAQTNTFQTLATYPAQNGASGLATADFTGPGRADLAIANAASSSISIYLSKGDGTFNAAATVALPGSCTVNSLTPADFNRDGKVDLLAACGFQNTLYFLPGNGDGTFGAPLPTSLPRPAYVGTAVAEGFFIAGPPAVADFTGDGKLDVVIELVNLDDFISGSLGGDGPYLLVGNGDGTFSTPSMIPIGNQSFGSSVAAGDFDGDGNQDLAVFGVCCISSDIVGSSGLSTVTSSVQILLGNGDGSFRTGTNLSVLPISLVSTMLVADVNSDGIPDLIVDGLSPSDVQSSSGNGGCALQVFEGIGDGTFRQTFSTMDPGYTVQVLTAHLLGAGETDLIEVYIPISDLQSSNMITETFGLRTSNGDGTYQDLQTTSFPSNQFAWPSGVLAADLNGDGFNDLAFPMLPSQIFASLGSNIAKNCFQLCETQILDALPAGQLGVILNSSGSALGTGGAGGTGSGSGCSNSLPASGQGFSASGGIGAINVNAGSNCNWSVAASLPWVTITSGVTGTGNSGVSFTVAANAGAPRFGAILVAGVPFAIRQEGAGSAGLGLTGSMAQLAFGGPWDTTFAVVNTGSARSEMGMNFYDNNGNALQLPLSVTQSSYSTPFFTAGAGQAINGHAVLSFGTTSSASPDVQVGSAQFFNSGGSVGGFAIFKEQVGNGDQEAVVPLETRNANSYLLWFDDTNAYQTGVALANVSSQQASIPVTIRDQTGATIETSTLLLPAHGHTSFVLPQQFAAAANQSGTVEFDTPSGGQITALGLRFNPNLAFTTIPVLTRPQSGGGTMAHFAVAGDWDTTFTLVNTGATPAGIQLSFYDERGNPLALPLSFPQSPSIPPAQASSFSQTIAAGATLVIDSQSTTLPTLLVGSAQLTTNGAVSGFAIFRYIPNGQEAVVPIETQITHGDLLAFDNSGGHVTGVAVANVSDQAAVIPAIIRDQTGAVLGTSTLNLAARGHISFQLPQQFAVTAGQTGTVEFDTPAGGQISVLGLRFNASLVFTTIPVLAIPAPVG